MARQRMSRTRRRRRRKKKKKKKPFRIIHINTVACAACFPLGITTRFRGLF